MQNYIGINRFLCTHAFLNYYKSHLAKGAEVSSKIESVQKTRFCVFFESEDFSVEDIMKIVSLLSDCIHIFLVMEGTVIWESHTLMFY